MRRSPAILALAVLMIALGSCSRRQAESLDDLVVSGPGSQPDDPALLATIGRLRIVAAGLEAYAIENNQYPVENDLEGLARHLVPTHVSRLPALDGWNRPARVRADGTTYDLSSDGPDRRAGAEASAASEDDITLRPGGALTLSALPSTSALARELASEQMAAIAAAIESYSIDNSAYPVARGRRLASVASLLEPTYIARVPPSDPWGGPYELIGNDSSFRVAMRGGDGRVDSDAARREGRGDDIVLPEPQVRGAMPPLRRGSLAAVTPAPSRPRPRGDLWKTRKTQSGLPTFQPGPAATARPPSPGQSAGNARILTAVYS